MSQRHFALLSQGGWFQVCRHGLRFGGVGITSIATRAQIAYTPGEVSHG